MERKNNRSVPKKAGKQLKKAGKATKKSRQMLKEYKNLLFHNFFLLNRKKILCF